MKRTLPSFRRSFALAAFAFASSLALAAAGCGGVQDPPPAPLAHHFDDMYIAQVAMDQRQAMIQAQQEHSVARMEKAKAEADLAETTLMLDVARNEAKSSSNDFDSAKKTKLAAEKSADNDRITAASKDFAAAELAQKSAKARVAYLDAYRNWLKKVQRYTDENQYWQEARFELAKSQLAAKNNISPKGFALNQYESQEQVRAKRAAAAKERATAAKTKASAARDTWLKLQAETDTAKGTKNSFPDPMGNLNTTGTGVTIGGAGMAADKAAPAANDPTAVPAPAAPAAPTAPAAPAPAAPATK